MLHIKSFCFGPFQENTFLLWDDNLKAVMIDPGMYDRDEEAQLMQFIAEKELVISGLWNTHGHIDHVMGNDFCFRKFGLKPLLHRLDLPTLQSGKMVSEMYGLHYSASPEPTDFVEHGDLLMVGEISCEVLFVPGHAPGHVAFYFSKDKLVVSGDVLFQGSVGRVDLPGGDAAMLEKSIRNVMYKLPDDTRVYCGHGPETRIGVEKKSNSFVWEGGSRL